MLKNIQRDVAHLLTYRYWNEVSIRIQVRSRDTGTSSTQQLPKKFLFTCCPFQNIEYPQNLLDIWKDHNLRCKFSVFILLFERLPTIKEPLSPSPRPRFSLTSTPQKAPLAENFSFAPLQPHPPHICLPDLSDFNQTCRQHRFPL